MLHPWHLTKVEMRALAAIVEHGTQEKAALELEIKEYTLREAIRRARKKMGVKNTLLAAIKWERWARERTDLTTKLTTKGEYVDK